MPASHPLPFTPPPSKIPSPFTTPSPRRTPYGSSGAQCSPTHRLGADIATLLLVLLLRQLMHCTAQKLEAAKRRHDMLLLIARMGSAHHLSH